VADEQAPPTPPPAGDRPPGWYPYRGAVNEQSYWDGTRWGARRRWNGSTWAELPPHEAEAHDAAAVPSERLGPTTAKQEGSGRASRRWIAIVAACIVLAGVVAAVLVVTTSGSDHHSTSAPSTDVAPPSSTTAGSRPTSTTTTAAMPLSQTPSSAQVAACQADAQSVEVALSAYQAQHGTYPAPPAPWSATTYASNFAPLTAAVDGGPYLKSAPGTSYYVIEYDASGNLWVAPPGTYGATYNPGQSFEGNPNICLAAVG